MQTILLDSEINKFAWTNWEQIKEEMIIFNICGKSGIS